MERRKIPRLTGVFSIGSQSMKELMQKKWILKQSPTPPVGVAAEHGCLPLVTAILAGRGYVEPSVIRRFLMPALGDMHNPADMKDMSTAVERLLVARAKGEMVWVYGDYDVDGITGTALLVSFFKIAGFNCSYFIPNRFENGYGLNREALERIIDGGAHLIVSVDCGITAVEEALFCRELGVDLIITDHHSPQAAIPKACAILNPLQPGCGYPFKFLSGVGVAFNLLVALRAALRDRGIFDSASLPDLRRWLDLVALGTIADVVPLVDQNRIYVAHGLRLLSDSVKPGIQALKRVAGINGAVSSGQVGFRLAPRLNAAGRMESAVPGVDLLLSDNHDESYSLAAELDAANGERQSLERAIFEDAVRMVENSGNYPGRRSIVLSSPSWHQGVIGIVASRLVERFHRPAILIAIDENGTGRGSGRGIPGFHLLDALTNCSAFLERFGGHRYAAGVNLAADRIEDFAAAFEAEASGMLNDSDLVPWIDIDMEVRPEDVTMDLARELKRLEPFGMGNPEPVFMMSGMSVVEQRVVGTGHLRLKLSGNSKVFNAIAFRMAPRILPAKIDVAFVPEINDWNGSASLQLRIRDLRPSE